MTAWRIMSVIVPDARGAGVGQAFQPDEGQALSGEENPEARTRQHGKWVWDATDRLGPAFGDGHRLIPTASFGQAGDDNHGRLHAGPLVARGRSEDVGGDGHRLGVLS